MKNQMKNADMFQSIFEDPYAYARTAKTSSGKRIFGYFCTYTPEELIHAAGAIPFRLFGARGDIRLADAHLQSYCCSLVRGGLEDALNKELGFLDGAVFPHTCDSIQRLSDIWRLNAGFPMHFDVVLPVKLDTASARQYMIDVLADFRSDLEKAMSIRITDADLAASIRLFNRIRGGLANLYALRSGNPDILPPSAMHRILKAAMVMDRAVFLEALDRLLDSLPREMPAAAGPARKRILVSGGICNHPDIYDMLADAGGDVIWDDLCTGSRYAEGQIDESKEPIEAIAERYLTRMVCPAKHLSTTARGENLSAAVRENRAEGVVFLLLKFCDPHAFDYPYLKQFLDDRGVANILLEIEEQPAPEGQLRTRFETFIDML